jgi:nucleotide-binding universal stress UspA family protein
MATKAEHRMPGAWSPKRVVVLFDASPAAARALEAAAELAGRLDVPLLAVRIDEPERTRSEALAFVREIGSCSGSIRPLDPDPGREAGAAPYRRLVERSSRRAIGVLEVDVRRGRLIEEALTVLRPDDCLLLGRVGYSARLGRKLGAAPLALARRAHGVVQICGMAPDPGRGCVAVLLEESPSSRLALELAAERARAAGRDLLVLHLDGDQAAGLRRRRLPEPSAFELLRALSEEGAAELVVDRGGAWLASSAAERLLARWPGPLIVTGTAEA